MAIRSHRHKGTKRNASGLCRSNDKVLAGVCAGIANHFEVDAIVVRVTCVVLGICTVGVVAIPYIVLVFMLPEQENDDRLFDVDPVSVASDKYQEVVEAQKTSSYIAPEQYGVHANAGHVPPKPPQGGNASSAPRGVYIAYRHDPNAQNKQEDSVNWLIIVLSVALATTALLIAVANSILARHPNLDLIDFWPELFVVAGIAVLVCFYDRISLALRLTGLLISIELCVALLPFTLGVCPLHALSRISVLPVILLVAGIVCFVIAVWQERPIVMVGTVVLFAVALAWAMGEMGVFERVQAAISYSRHNITLPQFRQ